MHDLFNTRGGDLGFVVEFEDGSRIDERQAIWDEVPDHKRIRSLSVVDFRTGTEFVSMNGYEKFFFMNEAVGGAGGLITRHTAKVFGGANPGIGAVELRLEFERDQLVPRVSKRELSWQAWEHEGRQLRSLRPGVPALQAIRAGA